MTGFALYLLCTCGLAGWMPRPQSLPGHSIGLRAVVGFHGIPLFLVGVHAIGGIALKPTAWLLVAVSAAGAIKLAVDWRKSPAARSALFHPIVMIPFVAVLVIAMRGGLGYIPYTGDEFSNWIGAAKQIFAAGGFQAATPFLLHPDFIVGWPLTLVFPMVVIGAFDEGLAAAAPFILQVAVLAFIFDLVVAALARTGFAPGRARLFGWLFLLVLMAGEVTGPIWSGDLLIEPPQELGYTAILLVIFLIFAERSTVRHAIGALAVIVTAQFLFKTTIYALVPALALALLLWPFLDERKNRAPSEFSQGLARGGLLFLCIIVPLLIVGAAWQWTSPSRNPISSPLSLLAPHLLSRLLTPDAVDLARRFATAVWSYVASYKLPLTVAALGGLTYAMTTRRYRVVALTLAVFFATYLAALYWFHLTGFGDYYFEQLNSIQRFTRVPLRAVHAIGFLFLALWAMDALERLRLRRVRHWACGLPGLILAVGGTILLGTWNTHAISRTVVDLKTRQYQDLQPTQIVLPRDAERIRRLAGSVLPKIPKVVLIDRQWTLDAWLMANYYAINREFGGRPFDFVVAKKLTWDGPVGLSGHGELTREELDVLREADLIWPIMLDDRLHAALGARISDSACAKTPTRYFLRPTGDKTTLAFSCIAKDMDAAAIEGPMPSSSR